MKMATLFLLLLSLTGPSYAYFNMCGALYRQGKCYSYQSCPMGTEWALVQTLFGFPICYNSICCNGTEITTTPTPTPPPPPPQKCGNDPVCGQWGPTARLAFSQNELPKQAPWQVSLRRVIDTSLGMTLENSYHLAGGVLVQDRWVLTDIMAALSVGQQNPSESIVNNVIVVVGDYNISKPEVYNNVAQEQVRLIKSVHYHPNYRYNTSTTFAGVFQDAGISQHYYQANSFCLLELTEPVVYNDWVRPICLPSAGLSCLDGNNCRVTGWGLTENLGLKGILQVAYLSEFSKPACEAIEYFRNNGTSTPLPNNTKCAADPKGTYSCVGDFGGPMACDDPANRNRGTLHGIMTFNLGMGCVSESTVMISDVSAVVDWVWDTCWATPA